jgi:hypothetical protein
MARYTGRALVVEWIYSGGTTNITNYRRSFETSESVDDADATCGTVTYRDHLPTFTDMTSTLEYLEDNGADGTAAYSALAPRTEGTVRWSPEGTANGNPEYYGAAYVQSRDRSYPYDDVAQVTINFQHTEEPTLTTWGA